MYEVISLLIVDVTTVAMALAVVFVQTCSEHEVMVTIVVRPFEINAVEVETPVSLEFDPKPLEAPIKVEEVSKEALEETAEAEIVDDGTFVDECVVTPELKASDGAAVSSSEVTTSVTATDSVSKVSSRV